ncbi:MAG: hypothetical protein ABI700_32930, partial [Chloroflexota bacterium]
MSTEMTQSQSQALLLDAQNVSTIFGGQGRREPVVAVDNVSLDIPAAAPVILTIVGESGSGKTTFTRNLLG